MDLTGRPARRDMNVEVISADMSTRRRIVMSVIASATGVSCGDSGSEPDFFREDPELAQVVDEALIVFPVETVPDELIAEARRARIMIVGEEHYQQEHTDFLERLIEPLQANGYRAFAAELHHAEGWLAQEHLDGRTAPLSPVVRALYRSRLDRLADASRGRPEEQRLRVAFFDVNHDVEAFRTSLEALGARLGAREAFSPVLQAEPDSAAYVAALESLRDQLADPTLGWRDQWGDRWFDLVSEVVEVEEQCRRFRVTRDFTIREATIVANLRRAIEAAGDGKVFVDTGGAHARYNAFGDTSNATERLAEDYRDRMFVIGTYALSGTGLTNFYQRRTFEISHDGTGPGNLFRIIGERAPEAMAFLPLQHPVFQRHVVMGRDGQQFSVSPAQFHDAILTHPRVTVLQGLRP